MNRADASAETEDWTVESLVPGGDGFLHLADGRAAFVARAFPGDVIRPTAVEARKGHVRATRFELVRGSPHRVTPPCPVAEACGGCEWMNLERSEQVTQKAVLLHSALSRTGHVEDLPEIVVSSFGEDLGYRSRVRFHVDRDGRVGFFARGTHDVVEIPACAVGAPETNAALASLRRVPKDVLAAFSEIEVRRAEGTPRVSVLLVARFPGGAGPAVRVVSKTLGEGALVSVAGEIGKDAPRQEFPLPVGPALAARPGVFTQVNWAVNVALVEAVVSGARARGARRFLDAYAGAGNFSLPLLASGMTGTSVEKDRNAVEDAVFAATRAGLPAGGFVVGDAADVLAAFAKRKEALDLVLLDPPRSGARDVLPSVKKLAPRWIALVSCDPVTASRDVGTLLSAGYRVESVRGFDMFPHTHHLETLAWLARAPAGPPP
ncbi:MAG TPA: hypothetical protein VHE30_03875 [Polyangiaceae bacterium]|nr:hypothetical protein [Polyangiaceae bacterium]